MSRICYLSFDDPRFPCARYRVLDPLWRHRDRIELRWGIGRTATGSFSIQNDVAEWADVVLIQRSFVIADTMDYIKRLLAADKPVIYETDDYLLEIPDWHNKEHHRQSAKLTQAIVDGFDLITVSTPALAERYKGRARDVRVVPNQLNEALWNMALTKRPAAKNDIRIELIGTRGHWYDFKKIEAPLQFILQRFENVRLIVKGIDPPGLGISGPRVTYLPPNMIYDAFVGEFRTLDIDIVLAPLVDHPFNHCISDIKWLEAGYCGIAGVFEDLAPYNSSVENAVTGLLAKSTAEWQEAIATLVENVALRRSIGSAARATIAATRTLATRSLDRLESIDNSRRLG